MAFTSKQSYYLLFSTHARHTCKWYWRFVDLSAFNYLSVVQLCWCLKRLKINDKEAGDGLSKSYMAFINDDSNSFSVLNSDFKSLLCLCVSILTDNFQVSQTAASNEPFASQSSLSAEIKIQSNCYFLISSFHWLRHHKPTNQSVGR